MYFPFARAGTPKRPYLLAVDRDTRVELRPTRSQGCAIGILVHIRTREYMGEVSHMGGSCLPLGVLLRGCGFTLEDCRVALEEARDNG